METVVRAPTFTTLLASQANLDVSSATLTMGTADRKKFELEFSVMALPAVITCLIAEAGRLFSKYPENTTPTLQGVRATGTTLAMKDDGTMALLLRLESGVELPLEFSAADLSRLRDQLQEATELADRDHHH